MFKFRRECRLCQPELKIDQCIIWLRHSHTRKTLGILLICPIMTVIGSAADSHPELNIRCFILSLTIMQTGCQVGIQPVTFQTILTTL